MYRYLFYNTFTCTQIVFSKFCNFIFIYFVSHINIYKERGDLVEQINNLISRVKEGDKMAYRDLMNRYYKTVQRFSFQCGVHPIDLDDVTQEVFIKLFRYISQFNDKHFTTWLYKITLNTSRDYYRKQSKYIEKINMLQKSSNEQYCNPIDIRLALDEEDEALHNAILLLSEKYRYPIVLYYFHDMTMAEIAKVLNLTISNVKVRIMRAKEQLRKTLQEEELRYER